MREEKIDFDRFARKKQELINRLSNRDPGILARNTSTNFTANKSDGGEFTFSLWDVETIVSFPEFYALEKITGNKLAELDQVMLLYYFDHADRTPLSNNWISFSELPDGQFYNQAFQGYTGNILVRSFSHNLDAFKNAAVKAGGESYGIGDSGFTFKILPKVNILVVYWMGDEDFPSSSQLLFDASAGHFLPTDAYAILGSTLTRKLIRAKQ
ncbi:MAG: DUF3786 domain-containing protein [Anaerolineales bacterium]